MHGSPVNVNMPESLHAQRRAEIDVFVRYCVARIERELDGIEAWEVWASELAAECAAIVRGTRHAVTVEARGAGADLAGAIWDAMSRIEQRLREVPRDLSARSPRSSSLAS
jgi:hypothetical protein